MAIDPAKLKHRLSALQAQRLPHEQVWRDCFDYSMPHLGIGLSGQQPLTAGEIQLQKARLLNGTAGEGLTTAADGFVGGMTPSNSVWFGIDVGRETDEEKSWLADAGFSIWENLHASNYDAESYDAVLHLLGAGWFVLYVDEDEGGGYYCENWPLSECYIAASRQGGRIDTIYRQYQVTVSEMMAEFGAEKVSEAVRQMAAAGKVDEKVCVVWVIEPRRDYLPGSQISTNLPFASCRFEAATNRLLSEGGYHEFPVVAPRWRRIPGSAYGIGPMSDALPDAKSANEVERWEFAAAETVIAPPLKVVDDGVINARSIKLGPRKIIVCNDVNNIEPLVTGAKVEFGQLMVERLERKVRKALMADLFDQIFSDPRMTATQVHAILSQIRQRMGPRFGRLQNEWLQPLIERCYGIALRAGVLGQPPQSLLQRNYGIKYLSPLARAQATEEVSSIEAQEQSLLAVAQAQPGVMDTHDWEAAARKKAELRGVPNDLTRNAKQVAQIQTARQQAQQAAQQQQIAAQGQLDAQAAMAQRMAATA